MTANNDAHVKAGLLGALIASDIIYEDGGRYYIGLHGDSDCTDALDAAIRALSADRGEAVAWKIRLADGTHFLTSDFDIVKRWAGTSTWAPLYAASAECSCSCPKDGNDYYAHAQAREARWEQVNAENEATIAALTAESAAPAQVSDADVIARCEAAGIRWLEPDNELPDGTIDVDGFPGSFDMASMAAMKQLLAAQPQPGRVEGMVLVPVDEIERAVKVMRYAAHPHTSPNADALARFMPTAGGDA